MLRIFQPTKSFKTVELTKGPQVFVNMSMFIKPGFLSY